MKKQALNPYMPSWEYVPDAEPSASWDNSSRQSKSPSSKYTRVMALVLT